VKYEKPELVGKASAIDSIHQQQLGDHRKFGGPFVDLITQALDAEVSVAAYQADE
jgi:hypothetical protein